MTDGALSGLRVLDMTEGVSGPFCTRLLAIYGAEVIKVERPETGDWARRRGPFFDGHSGLDSSVLFAYLNTNKRSLELDLDSELGQQAVRDLAQQVDVVVENHPAGFLARRGIGSADLRKLNPSLVVTSIPMFERGNRYADYRLTELNLYAMSGMMDMVGGEGRVPLKAGGYQAQYMSGVLAATLTLFAAIDARAHGTGAWIETSSVEACFKSVAHIRGYDGLESRLADRPPDVRRASTNAVLPCLGGHVTVTFYYFQKAALAEMLGRPDLATDPRFLDDETMMKNVMSIRADITEWLSEHTAEDAQEDGQSRHLLFTKVNSTRDLVESKHFAARGLFQDVPYRDGRVVKHPGPPFTLSGTTQPPLAAAPCLGEANESVLNRRVGTSRASWPAPTTGPNGHPRPAEQTSQPGPAGTQGDAEAKLPLKGIRVLDLTHRLAGPTMTMHLGDWGADVLKIEWWTRMDAWRGLISVDHDHEGTQPYNKTRKWLVLNRSKRAITLNLKTEEGKRLFLELVKQSDVVADNFSAGVMNRLGLGFDVLSRVNPRICMISMPGFGNSGPDAGFVGNGNTIEGYSGLASMTGYEDVGPRTSIGVWPDKVAGVHGAAAVATALYRREVTGRGQCIELAQCDTVVNMIGEAIIDYTANGTVQIPISNRDLEMAPHGVYPCAADHSWISIAVDSDEEWAGLCEVAGDLPWTADGEFANREQRRLAAAELDEQIAIWTSTQDAWELTDRLQRAGVPAAPMTVAADAKNPDFPSRGFGQRLDHEHVQLFPGPAARLNGQAPRIRRGPPKLGEHTREVLAELLGLSDEELLKLREDGVI